MIPASVRDGMTAKIRRMIEVKLISDEKNKQPSRPITQTTAGLCQVKRITREKSGCGGVGKKEFLLSGDRWFGQKRIGQQSFTEVERTAYADQWSEGTDDTVDSLRS